MDLQKAIESGFSAEIRKQIWEYITTPLDEKKRESFRKELVKNGFKFPQKDFDEYNLRFDTEYLNRLGGGVCMMPLEFQADYVDGICKEEIDDETGTIEQSILDEDITDESLKKSGATAVGNMAYIILHTKNEEVKKKCLDCLLRYVNIYLDSLMEVLDKQSKKRPIQ